MSRTKRGPLYDLCRSYKSQLWWALENYGKVWLSIQVYSNGQAIPWWYDCTGPERLRVLWTFSCNKRSWGCVLAPTLFSMMFSAMLTDAFQDCDDGFPIRYRFDGKLFNLRRLQAKSKVTQMCSMYFTMPMTWQRMPQQRGRCKRLIRVSQACGNYDLKISIKKTEVVYQPAPGKPYS